MGALMSERRSQQNKIIRLVWRNAYWARLSDLEKALLHRSQTYGRSCVCVRTCLSAEGSAIKFHRTLAILCCMSTKTE
jgi:hypothetical protein